MRGTLSRHDHPCCLFLFVLFLFVIVVVVVVSFWEETLGARCAAPSAGTTIFVACFVCFVFVCCCCRCGCRFFLGRKTNDQGRHPQQAQSSVLFVFVCFVLFSLL